MTNAVTRPKKPMAGATTHFHGSRSARPQKKATTARDAAACRAMMPRVPTPMRLGTITTKGSPPDTAKPPPTMTVSTVIVTLAMCGLRWFG